VAQSFELGCTQCADGTNSTLTASSPHSFPLMGNSRLYTGAEELCKTHTVTQEFLTRLMALKKPRLVPCLPDRKHSEAVLWRKLTVAPPIQLGHIGYKSDALCSTCWRVMHGRVAPTLERLIRGSGSTSGPDCRQETDPLFRTAQRSQFQTWGLLSRSWASSSKSQPHYAAHSDVDRRMCHTAPSYGSMPNFSRCAALSYARKSWTLLLAFNLTGFHVTP